MRHLPSGQIRTALASRAGDRIDVGTTSIEKTESLEHKYRLNKLEAHQLPVERAADLGLRCEDVVSTGMLWHLFDPDAGLWALGDMLAPSEAMQLVFCGPYGRACIRLLRTYCRQLGIGSSAQDIKQRGQHEGCAAASPAGAFANII